MVSRYIFPTLVAAALISCNMRHDDENPHCTADAGCLNDALVKEVDARCGNNRLADCKRSVALSKIVGKFDKAYFVERMGARLDECRVIPVPAQLAQTYTPLCQYILFEKAGKISSYLQGYCTSEVSAPVNEVGFWYSPQPSAVIVMEGDRKVEVERTTEKGGKGKVLRLYEIHPPMAGLTPLEPSREKCVGM